MIKKIVIWFVGITLVLLALLSYIGYRSFNTEAFKNHIVRSVQQATGRTFTVKGAYKLVWNPLPTITLENVSLSNVENSPNAEMFKADKIQIEIEWASLLKSPSRIKSVLLVKPEIFIERISRSSTNLKFPTLFAAQDALISDTLLGTPHAKPLIDSIRIEDGSIQYTNYMTKQTFQLTNLTGQLDMGTLSGPFSFKGKGTFKNLPLQINFSIGAHEISKPVDFLATFDMPNENSNLKIDARLYPEEEDKYFSGTLSFDIAKPNTILKSLNWPQLPEAENKNLVGSINLELGATKTSISDMLLKLGTEENAPTANITYLQESADKPSNLSIEITTLNLDVFGPILQEIYHRNFLSTLSTDLHVNISNLIWHQQTATKFAVSGSISDNQLKIPDAKASILLAGPTTIKASGLVSLAAEAPSLSAQIDLQSQNVAASLPFFSSNIPFQHPLEKIGKTEFSALLEWSSEAFNLVFSKLSVDTATGVAHFEQKENLDILVELNNLKLDKYISSPFQEETSWQQAFNKIFEHLKTVPSLTTAHWEIVLNNASLEDIDFQNMTASAETTAHTLDLEAMLTTQDQNSLILKTNLQNIGTPNWQTPETLFEVQGMELPILLQKLHLTTDSPLLQSAQTFSIQGRASGNPQNWTLETQYETPQIALAAAGQIINRNAQDMHITLQHKNIATFISQLWGVNPFQRLGGELFIETDLTQKENEDIFSELMLQLDSEILRGSALYNKNTQKLNLDLASDQLDLQKLLPDMGRFYLNASGFDSNPFDLTILKNLKGSLNLTADTLIYQTTTLKNTHLQAHIDENTLHIDNFIANGASENPSTLQARGTFDWSQQPSLSLKVVSQKLPLSTPWTMFDGVGLTKGLLTSEWNLATAGETPLQMARSLQGSGKIQLENTTWVGADIGSMVLMIQQAQQTDESSENLKTKIKHALENGSTPIDAISGTFTIQDGLWQTAAANINTPQATANSATIEWDIPISMIKAKAPLILKEYPTLPSFVLKLTKLAKDQKATYSAETEAFISALIDMITRQQTSRKEEQLQAQKRAQEQALSEAKESALEAFRSLTAQLNEMEQQLKITPNTEVQKGFYTSMLVQQNLKKMLQTPSLTKEQYQSLLEQTQTALEDLDKIKSKLTVQQKQDLQKKGQTLFKQTDALLTKINEMYQKRPTVGLLADLLSQAETQRAIISRALEQFKKPLSFDQTKKVSQIIKDAFEKINKLYDYAEEIYAGRQSIPATNAIKRVDL